MEFILESYFGYISEYLSHLEILSSELVATESQISIGLDVTQHYLLLYCTLFSLVGLLCLSSNVIYGMLSQNLDPAEWAGSSDVRFVVIVTVTTSFVIGFTLYFLYFAIREGFVFF